MVKVRYHLRYDQLVLSAAGQGWQKVAIALRVAVTVSMWTFLGWFLQEHYLLIWPVNLTAGRGSWQVNPSRNLPESSPWQNVNITFTMTSSTRVMIAVICPNSLPLRQQPAAVLDSTTFVTYSASPLVH
jgi:hypothetical protein